MNDDFYTKDEQNTQPNQPEENTNQVAPETPDMNTSDTQPKLEPETSGRNDYSTPPPPPQPDYDTEPHSSPINMNVRRRGMPTWAIVLISVLASVYLIVSIALIVGFFSSSTISFGNTHSEVESITPSDDDIKIESHLNISESPTSQGAPTNKDALTVKQISQKVRASVVGVISQGSATFSSSSVGSGIIMSKDGYIITNNHVIEGMKTIKVVLDDGKTYDARLIGADSRSDLAVIKINGTDLPAAEFGDSDKLEQGDPAIAIGNPAGLQLQNSVTSGIISAINRDIVIEDRTMTLIQTDASINPGNSGGPLVNEFGQVIGINTVKVGISYYEGLGFAIPINTAKPIIDELISRGYVKGRPSIGINGTTITERESAYFGLPAGLYIEYVHPNSDAFKKGIRRGDVITKMNGSVLTSTAEIKKIRDNFIAGDTVTLTIYRNGEYVDINVILMDEAILSASQSTPS